MHQTPSTIHPSAADVGRHRRGRVAGLFFVIATLVLAMGASKATAAPIAFPPTGLKISPASGPVGTHVTVTGTCGAAGKVAWYFGIPNSNGGPAAMRGDVPAGLTGNFTIQFTVPPGANPQDHNVVGAVCFTADPDPSTPIVDAKVDFKVTAAAPATPPTTKVPPAPVDAKVTAKPSFTG